MNLPGKSLIKPKSRRSNSSTTPWQDLLRALQGLWLLPCNTLLIGSKVWRLVPSDILSQSSLYLNWVVNYFAPGVRHSLLAVVLLVVLLEFGWLFYLLSGLERDKKVDWVRVYSSSSTKRVSDALSIVVDQGILGICRLSWIYENHVCFMKIRFSESIMYFGINILLFGIWF
jgi:hypothetical protein